MLEWALHVRTRRHCRQSCWGKSHRRPLHVPTAILTHRAENFGRCSETTVPRRPRGLLRTSAKLCRPKIGLRPSTSRGESPEVASHTEEHVDTLYQETFAAVEKFEWNEGVLERLATVCICWRGGALGRIRRQNQMLFGDLARTKAGYLLVPKRPLFWGQIGDRIADATAIHLQSKLNASEH